MNILNGWQEFSSQHKNTVLNAASMTFQYTQQFLIFYD